MEEDTEDRNNWRRKICCGDPRREKPEEEEHMVTSTSKPIFTFHVAHPHLSMSSSSKTLSFYCALHQLV